MPSIAANKLNMNMKKSNDTPTAHGNKDPVVAKRQNRRKNIKRRKWSTSLETNFTACEDQRTEHTEEFAAFHNRAILKLQNAIQTAYSNRKTMVPNESCKQIFSDDEEQKQFDDESRCSIFQEAPEFEEESPRRTAKIEKLLPPPLNPSSRANKRHSKLDRGKANLTLHSNKTKSKKIEDLVGFCIFTSILNGAKGRIRKLSDRSNVFLVEYENGAKHVLKAYCYSQAEKDLIRYARNEYELSVKLGKITPYVASGINSKELIENGKVYIESLFEWGGSSLYDRITKMSYIPPQTVLSWAKQSVAGLLAAENQGIFHSDIKPQNMVVNEGLLKIIDFGSAVKMSSRDSLLHTTTARIRDVTPSYLPPEVLKELYRTQFRITEESDIQLNHGKTDVYCWGMSFYHIITRKSLAELNEECKLYKRGNHIKYQGFIRRIREITLEGTDSKAFQKQIITILEAALAFDPNNRPTFGLLSILISQLEL
eukprot:TRINITY_DN13276_c0_g1_i3.p1 TRINITY_DN13276_c0_g1~~TRINITY_DN13276_c0_g1_i3.p1  ORF type:complete len:483 (+),score=132.18 TRINITY_DN13276_c0_g1_i3:1073-2521(+)